MTTTDEASVEAEEEGIVLCGLKKNPTMAMEITAVATCYSRGTDYCVSQNSVLKLVMRSKRGRGDMVLRRGIKGAPSPQSAISHVRPGVLRSESEKTETITL
ncbi:unnamed protein product [Linum tenue]|uniref:Uncharacterized protein n=1 Tax=Linum tenue TaxID=586396 RepID=A0AAV0J990_9ROSI|nr:unnamed protein product [Linum tenue]